MYDIAWYGFDTDKSLPDLIRAAAHSSQTEYVWLLHTSVDYSNFDLRFVPDRYQTQMLHAWPAHNNLLAFTTWLIPKAAAMDNTWDDLDKVFNDTLLPSEAVPTSGPGWHWQLDSRIDYSNFDLKWFPSVWEWNNSHAFAIKNKQQLSYTFLQAAQSDAIKYHSSDLELTDHLDFVTLIMINDGQAVRGRSQRYFGNMEDTLRTAIRRSTKEWLWITSDCCDYSDFDFNWLPDLDQQNHVHCWPSGGCEKGETFLINVKHYQTTGADFEFNFNHTPVGRRPWPVVNYRCDSLAEAVKSHPSRSLYTIYLHGKEQFHTVPEPCLWYNRSVIGMNRSNSVSLVPRDCVVEQEIYEYPHLIKQSDSATDSKMNVIFISSGESQAVDNYSRLRALCPTAKICSNNSSLGRLNGYQTAAHLSDSDWFIAVFAKCWVLDNFENFDWVPDYWQKPKHYIFMNHNTSNDLVYGHMAPIAYNTQLLLKTTGGLDMTLAQPHAVVPIRLSSVSLQHDPWVSWRTAFREVIKLLHYGKTDQSIEWQHRLWTWENHATGSDATWILRGAQDARAFYDRCDGELTWLIMSNEWDWCKRYFLDLYSDDLTVSIT